MMFETTADKRRAYNVANEIAQLIEMQLDEIEKLDGVNTVDVSYISLDEKKRCIEIDTEYVNADDGKRYSLHETVNAHAGTHRFFAQVFYLWLLTFANWFEHGIEFNGNA